jgi:ParB/RepB/Spo0J family partition protein
MGQGILLKQESEPLAITAIGERFQGLRIVDPSAERTILNSMRQYGQLTPVVICRLEAGQDELLDGFKRLRAARSLAMGELAVSRLEMGPRGCKAAILQLNRVGRNISSIEEALVVHSLCHDDGLSQVEIAGLLGRHKSWVSRRVALIARLSDEAQERIRLGLLPASLGSELARLQRCNQLQVLECIKIHHLTWRETRKVVSAMLSRLPSYWPLLLHDPRTALGKNTENVVLDPAEEKGLGPEAKTLLRTLVTFELQCLDMALLLSSTTLGRYESIAERRLRVACGKVGAGLALVEQELRQIEKEQNGAGD